MTMYWIHNQGEKQQMCLLSCTFESSSQKHRSHLFHMLIQAELGIDWLTNFCGHLCSKLPLNDYTVRLVRHNSYPPAFRVISFIYNYRESDDDNTVTDFIFAWARRCAGYLTQSSLTHTTKSEEAFELRYTEGAQAPPNATVREVSSA